MSAIQTLTQEFLGRNDDRYSGYTRFFWAQIENDVLVFYNQATRIATEHTHHFSFIEYGFIPLWP